MLSRTLIRFSIWLLVFGLWLATDRLSMGQVRQAVLEGRVKGKG